MNNADALTDLIAFTLTTAGKTVIKSSNVRDLGKILKAGEFGIWTREQKDGTKVISLFVQPAPVAGRLRALKRIGESDSAFDPTASQRLVKGLSEVLAA